MIPHSYTISLYARCLHFDREIEKEGIRRIPVDESHAHNFQVARICNSKHLSRICLHFKVPEIIYILGNFRALLVKERLKKNQSKSINGILTSFLDKTIVRVIHIFLPSFVLHINKLFKEKEIG